MMRPTCQNQCVPGNDNDIVLFSIRFGGSATSGTNASFSFVKNLTQKKSSVDSFTKNFKRTSTDAVVDNIVKRPCGRVLRWRKKKRYCKMCEEYSVSKHKKF